MAKLIKLTAWSGARPVYVNPDNVISVYYAGLMSCGANVDVPCTIITSASSEAIWVREDVEDVIALIHADA